MLWLCLHFPRLPAEALGLRDPFDVVTEQRGASRWLITAGPNVAAGMPLGTALSLQPLLRPQPRHARAERAALLGLAYRLYHYGSPVHLEIRQFAESGRVPQALLWVEIAASLRLFGGYDALRERLCAELAEAGQQVQLAVAPTRAAAALLAGLGDAMPIRGPDALERRLAGLPVTALPWPGAELEALHGVGLRRLGELRALPRAAFARRFGAGRLLELDRLYGQAAEPAEAIMPPPRFHRRFELAGEIEQVEPLLFPLRRLAYELQAWLRARDVTLREVRLEALHAQRRRTRFTLRFLDAHRDGARILGGLQERLAREPLPAAVRALELQATELADACAVQADLFARSDGQGEWTAAVERIAARLGAPAVWTPAPQADHRPERAWRSSDGAGEAVTPRQRPLWLLQRPLPLPAMPAPPAAIERIESGWWDGDDQRRDYGVTEWQGQRAWVFRTPDGRWFLHGLWG